MSPFLFFTLLIVASSGFEVNQKAAAGRVSDGIYGNEIVGPNLIKVRIFCEESALEVYFEFTGDNDANDKTKSTKQKQQTNFYIAT